MLLLERQPPWVGNQTPRPPQGGTGGSQTLAAQSLPTGALFASSVSHSVGIRLKFVWFRLSGIESHRWQLSDTPLDPEAAFGARSYFGRGILWMFDWRGELNDWRSPWYEDYRPYFELRLLLLTTHFSLLAYYLLLTT